jgi:hypothetical protein
MGPTPSSPERIHAADLPRTDQLNLAREHHERGCLHEASRLYQRALAAPADLNNLGIVTQHDSTFCVIGP